MKRIIVEGVDGSGKTTLIDKLRSEFHFLTVVVNEKQADQDFENWWPKILETDHGDRVPIHDRFYYSELVYGPIIRGNSLGSPALHVRVRNQLRREAFLIYARPSLDAIIKGAEVNPQMDGVKVYLEELTNSYDAIMRAQQHYYDGRFYQYDWRYKSDYPALVDKLERYLLGGN